MPRLFIALELPDSHLDTLENLIDPTLDARWTPVARIHLTLRFIGDLSPSMVEPICGALSILSFPPFSCTATGLDVFPSQSRPRVLVLNINPEPPLLKLQREIKEAIDTLNITSDPKPFRPHITLARFKRVSRRDVDRYKSTYQLVDVPPFHFRTFSLYESILTPGGAIHRHLQSFEADGVIRPV